MNASQFSRKESRFSAILVTLLLVGTNLMQAPGLSSREAVGLANESAYRVRPLIAPDYSVPLPVFRSADVTGPQRVIMLRVYFNDYADTSRYSQAEVEGFMAQVDTLWQDTSYGNISIDYQVSELYQLPDNRSEYVDDDGGCDGEPPIPGNDLSCGDKYLKVLEDAIAASPDDLDWTNIDAVLVLMAETDPVQFHRGQGGCCWPLPMGPDGDFASVAAAVVSEIRQIATARYGDGGLMRSVTVCSRPNCWKQVIRATTTVNLS